MNHNIFTFWIFDIAKRIEPVRYKEENYQGCGYCKGTGTGTRINKKGQRKVCPKCWGRK